MFTPFSTLFFILVHLFFSFLSFSFPNSLIFSLFSSFVLFFIASLLLLVISFSFTDSLHFPSSHHLFSYLSPRFSFSYFHWQIHSFLRSYRSSSFVISSFRSWIQLLFVTLFLFAIHVSFFCYSLLIFSFSHRLVPFPHPISALLYASFFQYFSLHPHFSLHYFRC